MGKPTCVRCGEPVILDCNSPNYGGVIVTNGGPGPGRVGDCIHHGNICAALLKAQRDAAVSALVKFRASLDELHYQTADALMAELSPDLRALIEAAREREEQQT